MSSMMGMGIIQAASDMRGRQLERDRQAKEDAINKARWDDWLTRLEKARRGAYDEAVAGGYDPLGRNYTTGTHSMQRSGTFRDMPTITAEGQALDQELLRQYMGDVTRPDVVTGAEKASKARGINAQSEDLQSSYDAAAQMGFDPNSLAALNLGSAGERQRQGALAGIEPWAIEENRRIQNEALANAGAFAKKRTGKSGTTSQWETGTSYQEAPPDYEMLAQMFGPAGPRGSNLGKVAPGYGAAEDSYDPWYYKTFPQTQPRR